MMKMANMSYCRFENTNRDLVDCGNAIAEALDEEVSYAEFFAGLNEYEQYAVSHLRRNAERFLELYAELKGE